MTCAALPSPARERLVRIAGMLGSAYPGERANAAEAATRLLEQYRLTWRDVLAPSPAPQPRPAVHATGGDHQTRARRVLARGAGRLTPWETDFLGSLARQLRTPSAKQAAVLDRLEARCR